MAADRRTPLSKGGKPAQKTPANAAALAKSAAPVAVTKPAVAATSSTKSAPLAPPATKAAAAAKPVAAVKPAAVAARPGAAVAKAAAPVKAAAAAKPKTPPAAVAKPAANPLKAATVAHAAKAAAPAVKAPPLKPAKGDYALEEQVGFHLRRAHQRASLIFNDVMGRFDITPTQFAALAKIDDEGAISQNHLGRLTAMDPSTILGVVGRLVRQGLVHLRSTPGDARLTLIELTLEGQKRVAEMKAAAGEVSKLTLAPLKPADAKTLTELLARIG